MQQQQIIPIHAIQKSLKDYRLSGMGKSLEIRIKQAEEDHLSYAEFLGMLLEDEATSRSDNKQKKLYKTAHLPHSKGIEDFDFSFQPSLDKQQIRELATCRFIEKKANVLFLGQPGTGKTHLATALGLSALAYGKTVLFTTASQMITTLQQSRADFSYEKKISSYVKPDLLILDELGYRSLGEKTVEDFFEIVTQRYEKGSIIITSNRATTEWDSVFRDKTLTGAILDRLVHHCTSIEITGDSYRFKKRD